MIDIMMFKKMEARYSKIRKTGLKRKTRCSLVLSTTACRPLRLEMPTLIVGKYRS